MSSINTLVAEISRVGDECAVLDARAHRLATRKALVEARRVKLERKRKELEKELVYVVGQIASRESMTADTVCQNESRFVQLISCHAA